MGSGRARLLVAGVVAVTVLWGGAARAQAPDRAEILRQARQHFLDGKKAFEGKRYPAAYQEFQAGYELEPKPGFLLDMAHAARKMGDLAQARELCQRFLHTEPSDAERRMAQQLVREIDRKLAPALKLAASTAAPSPTGETEATLVASEPLPEPPEVELPRLSAKPESLSPEPLLLSPVPQPGEPSQRDQPSSSRGWLWAGLAVVVVGAAAAVLILRARGAGDDGHASGSWGQVKL